MSLWWLPYAIIATMSVLTPLALGTTWKKRIVGIVLFLLLDILCFLPEPVQMPVNARHIYPPAHWYRSQ